MLETLIGKSYFQALIIAQKYHGVLREMLNPEVRTRQCVRRDTAQRDPGCQLLRPKGVEGRRASYGMMAPGGHIP
jgi:hypothetical protein